MFRNELFHNLPKTFPVLMNLDQNRIDNEDVLKILLRFNQCDHFSSFFHYLICSHRFYNRSNGSCLLCFGVFTQKPVVLIDGVASHEELVEISPQCGFTNTIFFRDIIDCCALIPNHCGDSYHASVCTVVSSAHCLLLLFVLCCFFL